MLGGTNEIEQCTPDHHGGRLRSGTGEVALVVEHDAIARGTQLVKQASAANATAENHDIEAGGLKLLPTVFDED